MHVYLIFSLLYKITVYILEIFNKSIKFPLEEKWVNKYFTVLSWINICKTLYVKENNYLCDIFFGSCVSSRRLCLAQPWTWRYTLCIFLYIIRVTYYTFLYIVSALLHFFYALRNTSECWNMWYYTWQLYFAAFVVNYLIMIIRQLIIS